MLSKETLDYFIPSISYYIILYPVCKKGELVVDPQTMERYCPACGNIAEEKLELSLPNEEITNPHHESTAYTLVNKGWAPIIPDGFFLSGALEAIHQTAFLTLLSAALPKHTLCSLPCAATRTLAQAPSRRWAFYIGNAPRRA